MSAHNHNHSHGTENSNRLLIAVSIIGIFLIAQLLGAFFSGSLSLLTDSGHMASDLIGLVIAFIALTIAKRPSTDKHTFGFRRFEVIGAMFNGFMLLLVAAWAVYEGVSRLLVPAEVEVQSLPMLLVAVVGLLANVIAMFVLRGGSKDSINLRGAYLEVFADTIGSLAVIAAALLIMFTGFIQADALASLGIAALILPRAYSLLKDVFSVLTQSAPAETDTERIRSHILAKPGVIAVHDLHIWQITTGDSVFSVHVVVSDDIFETGQTSKLLEELSECLDQHFDVEHSTFQFEPVGHAQQEHHVHS